MKMMMILILALSCVVVFNFACKKNAPCVTCSEQTICSYPPGNRTFTWRLDTVAWWPSEVGGVWAFSDNDAWVMGNMHRPDTNGQNTSYVGMHWDGEAWKPKISFTDVLVMPNDVAGDNHFMVAAGYAMFPRGTIPAIAEFDNNTKKWTGYQFQTLGNLYSVWTDGNGYFIAVGDNGMVYTKDGYSASWVYTKAATNFTFYHINGVSKNEVYASAYLSLTSGQDYEQYWKFDGSTWYKLFDNQDTTGNVINLPGDYSGLTDVAAYRCSVTDSLRLYLGGWDSFLLQSKGQSLSFSAMNLSTIGLPLHSLGSTAVRIDIFSPNDVWIFSSRYDCYQWNGINFQQMSIPGLPAPESNFGSVGRMVKTNAGKVFFPCEVSSQVYVVAQGTP